MDLHQKLKHLRAVEGSIRGLGRPMTQAEVSQEMQRELGETLSQAYLSQIEGGKRPHLSARSRALLARFFKVHPGYLVSDPPGYEEGLFTEIEDPQTRLATWLAASAEEWRSDYLIQHVFEKLAEYPNPRRIFEMLNTLLDQSPEELESLLGNPVT
ncbi:MAG TPA: helix-turn-helix transcriptional regulator [Ktedonobacterales bacterium]|nr:helix-turn-helix transcriptional regulator [Ktedonobacterales bacterium]